MKNFKPIYVNVSKTSAFRSFAYTEHDCSWFNWTVGILGVELVISLKRS